MVKQESAHGDEAEDVPNKTVDVPTSAVPSRAALAAAAPAQQKTMLRHALLPTITASQPALANVIVDHILCEKDNNSILELLSSTASLNSSIDAIMKDKTFAERYLRATATDAVEMLPSVFQDSPDAIGKARDVQQRLP